jgi:phospholipid:diacylglycerol acyltransferase
VKTADTPSADHVDILGNGELNEAILRIAGGRGDLVEETIYSDIKAYADKMDWD